MLELGVGWEIATDNNVGTKAQENEFSPWSLINGRV